MKINQIINSINRMNEEQRNYYKCLYEKSLDDEMLKTFKKGKDFIDEAIKVSDNKKKEELVTLFLLYLFDKQHDLKNQ